MKRLWAPWRMRFVENLDPTSNCVFCKMLSQKNDDNNFVVYRGKYAFAVLNLYPYTSGHMLIVANTHAPSLEDLDVKTRGEMIELATQAIRVLRKVYSPDAFNMGSNIGEAAGAGIVDHIHLHVVPRWNGDTSFISALGNTRVLPENLEKTYQRVLAAW
jgi:ATP adenylyltransferase